MTCFALTTLVIMAVLSVTAALAQTAAQEVASAVPPATARVPSFIVPVPPTSRKAAPALPRRMWPFLKARVEVIPAGPPTEAPMTLPLILLASKAAAASIIPAVPPSPERRTAMKMPKSRAVTAVIVVNGSEVPATTITITEEAKIVSHAGPLAPKAQATLKLPRMTGCLVTVAATFEGGSVSDGRAIDVCRVKLVRLTD